MVSLRGQSVDDDGEEDDEEDEEDEEEDDDDEEEGYEQNQEENRRNKMNVPSNHQHNDNDVDLPLSTSSSANIDVSSLLVKDLRTHLKELGLPAYGSKKELIERLLSHSEANSLSQPQPTQQELQSQPQIEPPQSPPQLQPSPLWRKSVTPPATIEENDLWTVSTIIQLLKDSPKRTSSSRIIGNNHKHHDDYEDLFALVVVTISIHDLSCRCLFHTSNITFSYTSLVEVLFTLSSLSLQYTMTP